jgi:phytoene dehydrogenase-like protein
VSADADAIVIGAGPNGLVAANRLAERGWSVLVLEAEAEPGGAVRSGELCEPGFTSDRFSSFHPLAAASPVIRSLELERYGLHWRRSPLALAHPQADGACAAISTDLDETAALLGPDGDAWRELYGLWDRVRFLDALLRPFPPVRAGARMARTLGAGGLLRFARFALLPVRRLGEERFRGEGARLLLAGNAMHADFAPESAGSGLFGWVLCGLAQQLGFPAPEGGAGRLTDALVARLRAHGGRIECGTRVERVLVHRGAAVGVRTADGREISAGRAVLASTLAPELFLDLVGTQHLPAAFVADLGRFEPDAGTVKVDWSLDSPIPWTADDARRAGTIHLADGIDDLTHTASQLARGLVPDRPFVVMGQFSMVDGTRQPPGRETAWAYARVPRNVREPEALADRVEAEVERRAPGFRALIRRRHVLALAGGSVNHGTAQIHQQLVFRPVPGLGRAETPIARLFLAGASAHPGGGVHGAPGANAAAAALRPGHRATAALARRLAR